MFQGARLTLGRARRGMNKTQLAAAARLKAPTITSYERGDTEPSPEIVERFSRILKFPTSFFYEELRENLPVDGASFRALSRMTASQRDTALATGALCEEFNDWIEERFDLPASDVPEIDPRIATSAAAAELVRARWNLGVMPIPNVLHLLESRGVRVFSLANECRAVGAFSFWSGRGTPFICLGTDKTAERSIFDSAHELGHLVLHRDHAAPRGREAEREADIFASNFLMPKADVEATALRNPDLERLAQAKRRWKVSAAALNYRLHELRMIGDWHYRDLCIEISRLGRHLELNPIQREQSQVLPKVLRAMKDEGVGRGDIAQALHLYAEDLEALLDGLIVSAIDGASEPAPRGQGRPDLRLVR